MLPRKRGGWRWPEASRVRVRPGAGARLRAVGLLKAGGVLLRFVDLRGRGKLSLEPREFRLVLVLAVAEAEGSAIF